MIAVETNPNLLQHLEGYVVDGTTVGQAFFKDGRLMYPGRNELEYQLKYTEPYTLGHEARVIVGLPKPVSAAIRMLANNVPFVVPAFDAALDVLWESHAAWSRNGISLDRLVAAMVMTQFVVTGKVESSLVEEAAVTFIEGMRAISFPLTREMFEELCDGADPICVALGMVEV